MKVKLVWTRGQAHDRVSVFIGPDHDHLALCGNLIMRPGESERFRNSISYSIGQPHAFTGMFETGWVKWEVESEIPNSGE